MTEYQESSAPLERVESEGAESTEALVGIQTVCEEVGLSARTVRYWEELGLLPGARRRQGGRRVYGAAALERMRFIQRLKTLGLSLAEIKELNAVYAIAGSTADMLRLLQALLDKHLDGLDTRIGQLASLRDEMKRYQDHIADRVRDDDFEAAVNVGEDAK